MNIETGVNVLPNELIMERFDPITENRPGPFDPSGATKNVVAAPPSALATARIIEDLDHISYPEGISGPKPELNANSKKGRFR